MFNQQVENLNLLKFPRRQAYSEPPTQGIFPKTLSTPLYSFKEFMQKKKKKEFMLHRASAEWNLAGWAEITVQTEATQGLAAEHLALT